MNPAAAPLACLTDAELEHLVGSPLAAKQMEWLDGRGWHYELTRRGKVRVARALFEQRMGVKAANDASAHNSEPDWTDHSRP